MKNILLCILLFTVLKGYGQQADTSEIYFDVNMSQMSTAGTRTLDSLRFSKIVAPGHKTMIYGFADYLGNDDANKTLSDNRAKKVKEYLVSLGMDPKDIIICEGKGRIVRAPRAGEHGIDKDRKVTIITELAPGGTAKAKDKKIKEKTEVNAATSGVTDSTALAIKEKKKNAKKDNANGVHTGTANLTDSAALAIKEKKKNAKKDNANGVHTGSTSLTDSAALAIKEKKKNAKKDNANGVHTGTTNLTDSAALAIKEKKKNTKKDAPNGVHTGTTNLTDSAALAMKEKKKNAKKDNANGVHTGTTNLTDSAALAMKEKKKNAKKDNANGVRTGTTNLTDSAALAIKEKKKNAKKDNPNGMHTGTTNATDSAALAAKEKKKNTKKDIPNGTDVKTERTNVEQPHNGNQTNPTAMTVGMKTEKTSNPTIAPIDGNTDIGPLGANTDGVKTGIDNKKGSSSVGGDSLKSTTKLVPRKPEVVLRKPEKDIPTLNPAKLAIGEIVPLNDIYFAPASNEMLRQSEPSLERLYKFLKENSNLAVEIEGRICCKSPLDGVDEPDGHGSTQSISRAKNIYDYLIAKGIEKKRITYAGLGNTKPTVYPEKTEYDRGLNRRPVMKILRK